MNSFNHYAYGAIGAWLYAVVGGIDLDPEQPAYKHIVMRPRPGGTLTFARATYQSPYGTIESEWHRDAGSFAWRIVVPPNTTATMTRSSSPVSELALTEPLRAVKQIAAINAISPMSA